MKPALTKWERKFLVQKYYDEGLDTNEIKNRFKEITTDLNKTSQKKRSKSHKKDKHTKQDFMDGLTKSYSR